MGGALVPPIFLDYKGYTDLEKVNIKQRDKGVASFTKKQGELCRHQYKNSYQ
jgi:hypothetical protein